MQHPIKIRKRNSRRGNALVEFGVSVPIFLAMVLGAVDFGRLHFEATVSQNAAATGSFYGARAMQFSNDAAGIESAALTEAAEVQSATALPEMICQCPSDMSDFGTGATAPCNQMCTNGYGAPRVYVRTRVSKTFSTFGWYPGVPRNTNINLRGWVRAQ